jgi:hypothetical protein
MHLPHAPLDAQYGPAAVGHASLAVDPLSPLQATHALDVMSQIGVLPLHCESIAHASQSPAFGPLVAQIVERHTVDPFAIVQGPSPFLNPHPLSFVSQTPDTHARPPIVMSQVPPGTGMPFGTFGSQTAVCPATRLLHQSPALQSESLLQPFPHTPVVVSQNGPAWVPVVQSLLVMHLPHAPVGEHHWLIVSVQASLAPDPKSPLQATHVSDPESHTGVLPVQSPASVGVHATQLFLFGSHTGVLPEHCESITHASHSPWFVPLVAQMLERHTVAPLVPSQGPSPFAKPQSLSFVSHTVLVQTSAPAAIVHVPSSVGLECAPSVGRGWPLATVGAQRCVVSLHHVPVAQSASTLHPPAGSHVPFVLHMPERHTTPPFATVQGPSPFA